MDTEDVVSQHVGLPVQGGVLPPATSKQSGDSESHRIYWQQWLSSNEKSVGTRREWVTSSAAVRISPVARAVDVTGLLRESLQLSPLEGQEKDALVLVGTLYSLSRDHVRFEHEKAADKYSGGKHHDRHHGAATSGKSTTSSDAFNVMHTLQPDDYPLQVRDRMADRLRRLQAEAVVGRTIISPKLQWYYCPVLQPADKKSLIPSCINLEGYCTSMEEDVDDWGYDDEQDDYGNEQEGHNGDREQNDSLDVGNVEDMDLLASRFPWLHANQEDDTKLTRQPAEMGTRYCQLKKQFRRESRRLNVLAAHESSLPQGTLSGYLLKRSSKDAHVWRRVHCVLTDDYLWFVSRRYTKYDMSFAKHGRVCLTRALLLEPSVDYAPLYRTPYAFGKLAYHVAVVAKRILLISFLITEMVAADGTSHIFRAANRAVQRQWIKSISDRIIQSYENSLLESAQLIINDECVAHARRIDGAVDQLWECIRQQQQSRLESANGGSTSFEMPTMTSGPVAGVMRWTLKVTEFRHFCRHVRSSLPAKSPVVVTTPQNTRKTPPPTALMAREASGEHSRVLDPSVKCMIRSAWQQAAALLQQATDLGQTFQTPHPHRNLETLLRHVDFVLTGRHRPARVSSGSSAVSAGDEAPYHDRGEPPPLDLFDALEKELQLIAVSMEVSP